MTANGTEFDDVFKLSDGDEDEQSAASDGVVPFSAVVEAAEDSWLKNLRLGKFGDVAAAIPGSRRAIGSVPAGV